MFKNKKGQIEIPILVLILFAIFLIAIIGKVFSFITIDVTRQYSEELNDLDMDFSTLLNYNNCGNSELPVKELVGLSLVSNSFNPLSLDYGGELKDVNVESCINKVLNEFYDRNSKKYMFFVKFNNKNYFTIKMPWDLKGEKITVMKIIPVPKEDYYAEVYLSAEKR